MILIKRPSVLIVLAGVVASLSGLHAQDINQKPYAPIPAVIGKLVVPEPALVAVASQIKEAAESADVEAIFALMAKETTFVSSGITLATSRRVKKQSVFADANSAFFAIGKPYQEGERPGLSKADTDKILLESTISVINEALEAPKWGLDPLLKGMVCTYRGATWNKAAAEKAGAAGSRGYFVAKPMIVRAKADAASKSLGFLKPGTLYAQGFPEDNVEGWAGIRLPNGKVGHVKEADLFPATTSGLCFSKGTDGKWLLAVFSAATL